MGDVVGERIGGEVISNGLSVGVGGEFEDGMLIVGMGRDDVDIVWVVNGGDDVGSENDFFFVNSVNFYIFFLNLWCWFVFCE